MIVKTKSSKQKFTSGILVTFTPAQKKAVQKYATSKGLTTASFIRFQTLKGLLESEPLINQNHALAKFSGVLNDEIAEKMLADISESRENKE